MMQGDAYGRWQNDGTFVLFSMKLNISPAPNPRHILHLAPVHILRHHSALVHILHSTPARTRHPRPTLVQLSSRGPSSKTRPSGIRSLRARPLRPPLQGRMRRFSRRVRRRNWEICMWIWGFRRMWSSGIRLRGIISGCILGSRVLGSGRE